MEAAVKLLGLAQQHLGAGLTGFEVMGQFALQPGGKHIPQLRVPFVQDSPYCVLLENSDTESEAHAREQFERCWKRRWRTAAHRRRGGREHRAGARSCGTCARSIPLAQAEEGLNIKHDISVPVSRIPAFCAETDALLQREIPACGW
jgi:hypothetical protein